ncbi:hypothetical protein E9993_17075 [Labilibacter sediminis]|nr:hypothetical protein E9993_17075 [Labilibacter sediminis]
MNAICYIRTSTNNKQDIQRQIAPIKVFCDKKNLKLLTDTTFQDKVSGSVIAEKRNGYKKLMRYVENYKGDNLNVVFDEVSRLGRDQIDILTNIRYFTQRSVNVHFVNPECTYLDSDGNVNESASMIISLFAQFAEAEKNRLKTRIQSSVPRTATEGKTLGGVETYGYTVDDVSKKIIIDKIESEYVKEIFKMYNAGSGSNTICNYLNNSNIPSKKGIKWLPNTILQIIKNRHYIGERSINGEVYQMPRIISDETFQKAEKIRQTKAQYITRERKHVNPLVRRLYCGCGSMTIVKPKKLRNGKETLIYKCNETSKRGACGVFSTVNYHKLNNSIYLLFSEIVGDHTENKRLVEELIIEADRIKNISIKNVISKLNRIDEDIERVADNYADGLYSKEKRNQKILKIKTGRTELDKKLIEYKNRLIEIDQQLTTLKDENSKDSIVDSTTLKHFVHKFIKRINITRISKPDWVQDYKFRKDEVFYDVAILTMLGKEINYLLTNHREGVLMRWSNYVTSQIIDKSDIMDLKETSEQDMKF